MRFPGLRVGLRLMLWVFLLGACTPAERQALGVPVISQIDAVGIELARVMDWCQSNGAPPAQVAAAVTAASTKDYSQAVALVEDILAAQAAKGEQVPPEVAAAVQVIKGALAALAVQDFARAVSTP